jgi:hypothetical protein
MDPSDPLHAGREVAGCASQGPGLLQGCHWVGPLPLKCPCCRPCTHLLVRPASPPFSPTATSAQWRASQMSCRTRGPLQEPISAPPSVVLWGGAAFLQLATARRRQAWAATARQQARVPVSTNMGAWAALRMALRCPSEKDTCRQGGGRGAGSYACKPQALEKDTAGRAGKGWGGVIRLQATGAAGAQWVQGASALSAPPVGRC